MTRIHSRLLLGGLSILAVAIVIVLHVVEPNRSPAPPPLLDLPAAVSSLPRSTGWQSLFNGRDLTGWQHLGGGKMSVQDGQLVLEHDDDRQPGYFISEVQARDFVARFRCQVVCGDSGFFYRSRRDPRTPTTILGPQVQLNSEPGRNLGGIYETQGRGWVCRPLTPSPSPHAGEGRSGWLDCEITVQGVHVKVVIDQQTTVDFDDDPGANPFREVGFFALQIHGGGACRILFERIEVRVLA